MIIVHGWIAYVDKVMKLRDAKNIIKHNPSVLFKRPQLIFYLPLIIARYLWVRFKYTKTTVYFVETEINDYLELNLAASENFDYKVAEVTNYKDFEVFAKRRYSEDKNIDIAYEYEIRKRFSNGNIAFLLANNNEDIGFIFVQTGQAVISQIDYTICLPQDTFAFIDLYIFNDYRKRKLHELLYTLIIRTLNSKGYTKFYCWLMEHNQISIKAHSRIGIQNVTKIFTRHTLFGINKLKVTSTSLDLSSLLKEKKV